MIVNVDENVDTALQRQQQHNPTKARRISPGYLAAAGARNFNIRRGSTELAITESRGGMDPPLQRRAVSGGTATYVIS